MLMKISNTNNKKKSVFCVFYCKSTGRFLYELRSSKVKHPLVFGLFGGGIDKGETPKQAMIRELQEEIGMTFNRFQLKLDLDYIRLYGIVVSREFIPKLSWESESYLWSKSIPEPMLKKMKRNIKPIKVMQLGLEIY